MRTEGEVAAAPFPLPSVNLPTTKADLSSLKQAEARLPDKDATILCFCGIGFRVVSAKQELEAKGYKNVVNVGGYKDVVELAEFLAVAKSLGKTD